MKMICSGHKFSAPPFQGSYRSMPASQGSRPGPCCSSPSGFCNRDPWDFHGRARHSPERAEQLSPGRKPWVWGPEIASPEGYAIVPAAQSKLTQPVIVQYVAPPNMLWYAPYRTIEGATQKHTSGSAPQSVLFSKQGIESRLRLMLFGPQLAMPRSVGRARLESAQRELAVFQFVVDDNVAVELDVGGESGPESLHEMIKLLVGFRQ